MHLCPPLASVRGATSNVTQGKDVSGERLTSAMLVNTASTISSQQQHPRTSRPKGSVENRHYYLSKLVYIEFAIYVIALERSLKQLFLVGCFLYLFKWKRQFIQDAILLN